MASQPRAFPKRASRTTVHLTPTETAVLTLLPTHLTLAAIGDHLGISRPTVKTHVQHIYKKLGAANRAEAVDLAESAELLPAGRKQLRQTLAGGGETSPARRRHDKEVRR